MIVIRGATVDDYEAFTRLYRELGNETPAPSYHQFATELTRSTLVADRDGAVAGFIDFYALSAAGHIRSLAVAPAARRSGVGAELMLAAADRLRAGGIAEWHLNVRHGNAAAIRLYEKLGMEIEHRSTVFRIPWAIADALPRATAIVSDVSPEDDDDIERALKLVSGRVAMRRRANSLLFQLRDDSCAAVGFAALDPAVGASPFRVARPGFIGTLLAALRGHVTTPYIQIVLEDCPDCTGLLAQAGAEVRLELLHYRGSLG